MVHGDDTSACRDIGHTGYIDPEPDVKKQIDYKTHTLIAISPANKSMLIILYKRGMLTIFFSASLHREDA
jgi:hypothetical protein